MPCWELISEPLRTYNTLSRGRSIFWSKTFKGHSSSKYCNLCLTCATTDHAVIFQEETGWAGGWVREDTYCLSSRRIPTLPNERQTQDFYWKIHIRVRDEENSYIRGSCKAGEVAACAGGDLYIFGHMRSSRLYNIHLLLGASSYFSSLQNECEQSEWIGSWTMWGKAPTEWSKG